MMSKKNIYKIIASIALVACLGFALSKLVAHNESGISEMASPAYAVKSQVSLEQLPIDAVSKDAVKLAFESVDGRKEFISASGISVVLLK